MRLPVDDWICNVTYFQLMSKEYSQHISVAYVSHMYPQVADSAIPNIHYYSQSRWDWWNKSVYLEMKGPTNNISVIEDDSGPLEKISLNITLFNCSMQHKSSPMVAHDLDFTVTSSLTMHATFPDWQGISQCCVYKWMLANGMVVPTTDIWMLWLPTPPIS